MSVLNSVDDFLNNLTNTTEKVDSRLNTFSEGLDNELDNLLEKSRDVSVKGYFLKEAIQTIDLLQKLNLKVTQLSFLVGVPPEINTILVGVLENIHKDKIQEMLDNNSDKKLLVIILTSLLKTLAISRQLGLSELEIVKIDIILGISPAVSVNFLQENYDMF